jgi:hypothetical protein
MLGQCGEDAVKLHIWERCKEVSLKPPLEGDEIEPIWTNMSDDQ